MCDEFTRPAEKAALTRRGFAALGTAAVIAACSGGDGEAKPPAGLTGRMVRVTTPDGTADAFFVHPARGVHPGIVLWPDIAGLRDAIEVMARRLAEAGYAVLAVNQFYRNAPAPVLNSFAEWRTPAGQARLQPMIAAITPDRTMRDAAAFVAFLDGQKAVDKARRIGAGGYCMGGAFAVRTAAAVPGRVGAVASLHGANLTGAEPDSPVNLIAGTRASFFFAIGRNDDARMPEVKDRLREAAAAAGRPAGIEVFPADHGWTVPDTPVFDKAQADRARDRMLALFSEL
ncbi:MAG: dienelactone hydrolase family protein [Novosphingobium sp.]|jgi:carboxymethylenebutenolidase|nr:dienelactone hydrolase family protein [Novosphingobium sp.]